MPQLATLRKAPTVASRSPNGGLLLHCAKQTQACIRAVYTGSAFESQWADATCTFSGKLLAPKRRGALKRKRAGPSHKPHPKATCPHPTRPLRPPGRRARDDYAQLAGRMQQKVVCFFHALFTGSGFNGRCLFAFSSLTAERAR